MEDWKLRGAIGGEPGTWYCGECLFHVSAVGSLPSPRVSQVFDIPLCLPFGLGAHGSLFCLPCHFLVFFPARILLASFSRCSCRCWLQGMGNTLPAPSTVSPFGAVGGAAVPGETCFWKSSGLPVSCVAVCCVPATTAWGRLLVWMLLLLATGCTPDSTAPEVFPLVVVHRFSPSFSSSSSSFCVLRRAGRELGEGWRFETGAE